MADKRDYYEILGVSKSSTPDEIKKAYRKLAKKHHPDVNSGNKESEHKFKEANEAYEVLSNQEKKSRYDQFGHAGVDPNGFSGGGGFGDFGGFGDIFDTFFGGSGFGSSSQRRGPKKGRDIRTEVELTFEESAFGVEKEVSIFKMEGCDSCEGTGAKQGTKVETCKVCNGTGEIKQNQRTPFGQFINVKACDNCHGEGKIIIEPCKVCHGNGKVRRSKKIKVNIPPGIDDGQTVSLRGEGDYGESGGMPGDLYIYVHVKPHSIFKRQGTDVICEIPITFVDASLGAEIEVPTLDGKVKYSIHEGTQSGTVFRLKNKGINHVRGYGRGDQYVKVFVEVPKNLKARQKELLKEFAEIDGEDTHEQRKGFFKKMKDVLKI